jgi:hypothetical protein
VDINARRALTPQRPIMYRLKLKAEDQQVKRAPIARSSSWTPTSISRGASMCIVALVAHSNKKPQCLAMTLHVTA